MTPSMDGYEAPKTPIDSEHPTGPWHNHSTSRSDVFQVRELRHRHLEGEIWHQHENYGPASYGDDTPFKIQAETLLGYSGPTIEDDLVVIRKYLGLTDIDPGHFERIVVRLNLEPEIAEQFLGHPDGEDEEGPIYGPEKDPDSDVIGSSLTRFNGSEAEWLPMSEVTMFPGVEYVVRSRVVAGEVAEYQVQVPPGHPRRV